MSGGGWITDKNDEACYIDIYNDEPDEDHEYSRWCDLPDLLLEDIFSYLSIRERYYASLVCRNWYRIFYMPKVWSNFLVDDRTLTHAKFNYYSGWQHVLDHYRTQCCFTKIGTLIKGLDFRPVHSFNNVYQFMTLIAWCIEQGRKENCTEEVKDIGKRINSLSYIFPCNMAVTDDPEGVKLFGTGGQLLAALKRLLMNLNHLKILKLIDLMLERYEAKHLLDEVLDSCSFMLKTLYLVNVTNLHCPIMHIGLFFNLQVLVITPQNIDDDVLQLIGDSKIHHLHLYQNRYTPNSISISPCSAKAWRNVKQDNKNLTVHLSIESNAAGEILIQPEAPVTSILYQTPKTQITTDQFIRIIDMYKTTLNLYGHEKLPRFSIKNRSFNCRIDSLLVLMVRQCPFIRTLVIRERISTATVLLLVKIARHLETLYVRKNAIILRCDWPKNPEWTDEFYNWLRKTSKSYDSTELEVSRIIGYPWKMLSDRLFKNIQINVRRKIIY